MFEGFKETSEIKTNRFAECPLGKRAAKIDGQSPLEDTEQNFDKRPIQSKIDGLEREHQVEGELQKQYSEKHGYSIISEVYLRNEDGKIVEDPETGEKRRIDFVVVKDGKVVDSIEVTSLTADKTKQTMKEERIREAGGNYIRDYDGNLLRIPDTLQTRIERRD